MLCILIAIFLNIASGGFYKDGFKVFIFSAIYPVSVPALSAYLSCREIFLGEDWTEDPDRFFDLNDRKALKMFEYIGEFYVPNN